MNARIVALGIVGLTLSVAACSSNAEEDTGSDDGALSAATCKPRAEQAQAASKKQCQDANPLLDWNACMKPADDAWIAFHAKADAAYQAVKAEVDEITGDCKQLVDSSNDSDVVSQAMSHSSDYARASALRNPTTMSSLRQQLKMKCDADAKDDLAARLASDDPYLVLVEHVAVLQASYTGTWMACAAKGAYQWTMNTACTGALAYESTYRACRKECKTLAQTACVPDGYPAGVECGAYAFDTSFFYAGTTCEESTTCKKTDLCTTWDDLKSKLDAVNQTSSCATADGKAGTLVPVIVKDASGKATRVDAQCKAATAS